MKIKSLLVFSRLFFLQALAPSASQTSKVGFASLLVFSSLG